jgi:two-component system, NarL family, response regulator YdfI
VNGDRVVRVAIAAASDVECARLEALLAAETDLRVVGSVVASPALADLVARVDPDVLLFDLGSEAAETLEHIAERVRLPATILLRLDTHSMRHLLDLGVRAVLTNHDDGARLIAAIKAVAAGLIVLDEDVAHIPSMSEGKAANELERIDALTPRETELLQMLAEGLPNKEIAKALGISEHTVKFHLSSIFGKLGAMSRTEAVAIGIRRGLVML